MRRLFFSVVLILVALQSLAQVVPTGPMEYPALHIPKFRDFWFDLLPQILLVVFTGTLWWSTRQLVKGAETNAERQLRAYVFLDPANELTIARRPSSVETFEVAINVKNTGLTPAYKVVGYCWTHLGGWPLPEDFNFAGPLTSEPDTHTILAAGAVTSFHTGTSRPLTSEELQSLQSGALRLYMYGHVTYVDAFGKARVTTFCRASTAEGASGYATALAATRLHNDAT